MEGSQGTILTHLAASQAQWHSAEVGSLDKREEPRIPTISVKVISPGKKSEYKTFLVRGVTVDDHPVQELSPVKVL